MSKAEEMIDNETIMTDCDFIPRISVISIMKQIAEFAFIEGGRIVYHKNGSTSYQDKDEFIEELFKDNQP